MSTTIEEIKAAVDRLKTTECHGTVVNTEALKDLRALLAVERQAIGWFTDDHLTDKSATTYDASVADRWRAKGWPVSPLYTSASSLKKTGD